jgi:hypothetical protein
VVKNGAKTSSPDRDLLMKFRPLALYCKFATGVQFFFFKKKQVPHASFNETPPHMAII